MLLLRETSCKTEEYRQCKSFDDVQVLNITALSRSV